MSCHGRRNTMMWVKHRDIGISRRSIAETCVLSSSLMMASFISTDLGKVVSVDGRFFVKETEAFEEVM